MTKTQLTTFVAAETADIVVLGQQKGMVASASHHHEVLGSFLVIIAGKTRLADYSLLVRIHATLAISIAAPKIDLTVLIQCRTMSFTR